VLIRFVEEMSYKRLRIMSREVDVRIKAPAHHVGDIEREVSLAYAIDLFLRGIVSIERAAELADIHLYDFILELKRRGLYAYPYSNEELRKELKL